MAQTRQPTTKSSSSIRDIAYCMDALVPGFYIWWGNSVVRLGGCKAEPTYPGTIHDSWGMTIVLPGYQIFTTYQGCYDP